MAKFITMKFHGINMLVLLLITLYLCYIALQSGINIWFAAATYTEQTTSLVEKIAWFFRYYGVVISFLCIATLWIPKFNGIIVTIAMVIYLLLLANIDAPDGFFDTPSSFVVPCLVVLFVIIMAISNFLRQK